MRYHLPMMSSASLTRHLDQSDQTLTDRTHLHTVSESGLPESRPLHPSTARPVPLAGTGLPDGRLAGRKGSPPSPPESFPASLQPQGAPHNAPQSHPEFA